MSRKVSEEVREHLCPTCRGNPQLQDILRRTGLREQTYEAIIARSHASTIPVQHRLDVTTNFVIEHLTPELSASEERNAQFRVISSRTHPELERHDLRIAILPNGTLVTSVMHPRSEMKELLRRGHYLSLPALNKIQEEEIP